MALPFSWEPQFCTPLTHFVHHGRSAGPQDGSLEPQFGTPLTHFVPHGPTGAIRWRSRRLKGASIRHTPHALRASGPSADPSDGSSELKLGTPLTHFVPHGPPKALSWPPRPPNPLGTPRLPDENLQRLVPTPWKPHPRTPTDSKICVRVSLWGPAVIPALQAQEKGRGGGGALGPLRKGTGAVPK